jgi:hypothetical protein
MTWLDITDNAINAAKIIIPVAITAFVAIATTAFNHLAASSKERRERKLKLLEEASDAVFQYGNAFSKVLGAHKVFYLEEPKTENALYVQECWNKFLTSDVDEKLNAVRRRLRIYGLGPVSKSLGTMQNFTSDLHYTVAETGKLLVAKETVNAKLAGLSELFRSVDQVLETAHKEIEEQSFLTLFKSKWKDWTG